MNFSSNATKDNNNNDDDKGVYDKIAFIGAGKMAQALISPLVNTSIQPEENISIYDVSISTMNQIQNDYPKIQLSKSIPDAIEGSDLIILAVKPQNVCKVYSEMVRGDTIRSNATLLRSVLVLCHFACLEKIFFVMKKKNIKTMSIENWNIY